MQKTAFNIFCPVEIGDRILLSGTSKPETVEMHVITDICCLHYLKAGAVNFLYELDGSGTYIRLDIPTNSVSVKQ